MYRANGGGVGPTNEVIEERALQRYANADAVSITNNGFAYLVPFCLKSLISPQLSSTIIKRPL